MDSEQNSNTRSLEELKKCFGLWPEMRPFVDLCKFHPYGTPTIPIPSFHFESYRKVVEKAKISDYQYSSAGGRRDLVESIIEHFPPIKDFKNHGINVEPNNLFVSCGALQGMSHIVDIFCKPGDEVLGFEPIYPGHFSRLVSRTDIKLKTVRMIYDKDLKCFSIDFQALKNAITEKTRILHLINPQNPTGKLFTETEYKEITNIIRKYPNLLVIEDCAYFLYRGKGLELKHFATVDKENMERTFTIFSSGKIFNVTGLRVGIVLSSNALISQMKDKFMMEHVVPSFEQMVVREDLVSANMKNEKGEDFYDEIKNICNQQAERLREGILEYGIQCSKFEGTYYMILDIESFRGIIDEKYYLPMVESAHKTYELDKAFARLMYDKFKIGLIPLSNLYFGEEIPDYLVRISINRSDEDIDLVINSFKILSENKSI